jgi:hypothetical protein
METMGTEDDVPESEDSFEQLLAELRARRARPPERTPEEMEKARREFVEMLDELDEEFGKPSEEDDAWARRVLGL